MKYIKILFFLVVFAGVSACKNPKNATASKAPDSLNPESSKKRDLTDKEKMNYEFLFHSAGKEKILGNFENAAGFYAQCLKIDNNRPTPFYELSRIYAMSGNNQQALELSKQAYTLDPSNKWFALQYGDLLTKTKNYEKAADVYERLSKRYPENPDYLIEWANSHLMAGKISESVKVYDQVEKLIGISENISLQKKKIYLSQGNVDKAIGEVKKLNNAFPLEAKYYGMLAELYQSKGMEEKALETFQKILEFDPENPYVHLSLSDYYNQKGEMKKAFEHLDIAFSSQDLDIDTKVKILLSYYVVTEKKPEYKDDAFLLVKKLVEMYPEEGKSYSIYGDFLLRDEQYSAARDQFRKALEFEKDKFVIWNQVLLLNSELNDFDSMEKESAEALELFPMQPSLYLFNGIANSQKKQYREAIEMFETGAALVIDNKPLQSQFYSSLGDVYYQTGDYGKSDTSYEKSLKIDPKNVYVLNNYSYYLSLRNENLERAEEMSRTAVEIIPNSSSFLDTHAWVLYRLGKYSEAKKWIEKAIGSDGGENGVILEHYGDILFKLNEFEKALEMWKKAQVAGGGSDLLEKKIKEKKLIEN